MAQLVSKSARYDWKKRVENVRSGIRTHAYKSRLRPERSALDHSAILTLQCKKRVQILFVYCVYLKRIMACQLKDVTMTWKYEKIAKACLATSPILSKNDLHLSNNNPFVARFSQ